MSLLSEWYETYYNNTNLPFCIYETKTTLSLTTCREHDMDYWRNVVFLDEKTFRSDCHGRLHCWRPNGTLYDQRYMNPTHHQGHVTVNMEGWMWSHGVGQLHRITKRFTGIVCLTLCFHDDFNFYMTILEHRNCIEV